MSRLLDAHDFNELGSGVWVYQNDDRDEELGDTQLDQRKFKRLQDSDSWQRDRKNQEHWHHQGSSECDNHGSDIHGIDRKESVCIWYREEWQQDSSSLSRFSLMLDSIMIQSLVLSTKNEEERSLVKSKRDKENVKRERERERESSTGKQSISRRLPANSSFCTRWYWLTWDSRRRGGSSSGKSISDLRLLFLTQLPLSRVLISCST